MSKLNFRPLESSVFSRLDVAKVGSFIRATLVFLYSFHIPTARPANLGFDPQSGMCNVKNAIAQVDGDLGTSRISYSSVSPQGSRPLAPINVGPMYRNGVFI